MPKNGIKIELRTAAAGAVTRDYLVAKVVGSVNPRVGDYLTETQVRSWIEGGADVTFSGLHGTRKDRL